MAAFASSELLGEEIASRIVMCELKRIWVDLKSNPRGKFIKISEQDSSAHRSKILIPVSAASRFIAILANMANLDASMGPADAQPIDISQGPSPPLKSESLRAENKMFYFDLRQNARGRFLKISQQVMGQRATIVVPARGIAQLRDAVEEVCKADPQASAGLEPVPIVPQDQLPQSQQVSAEQKRFFFDVGSNSRGVFLRISEVQGTYRTAITIPRSAWGQFRDLFQQYGDALASIPDAPLAQ